jgi:hypothetical protein
VVPHNEALAPHAGTQADLLRVKDFALKYLEEHDVQGRHDDQVLSLPIIAFPTTRSCTVVRPPLVAREARAWSCCSCAYAPPPARQTRINQIFPPPQPPRRASQCTEWEFLTVLTTVCLLHDGAAPRMQDTFTLAVCRLVHHLVLFGFMNHPIASVLASPEIEGLDRYAGRLEALAGNLVRTATDKESAVAAVRTGLRV